MEMETQDQTALEDADIDTNTAVTDDNEHASKECEAKTKNEQKQPESVGDGAEKENRHVTPLTLVLFGDSNAVEQGPNLLLDRDKDPEPFSSTLYDLYGRVVSVIDLLGQKSADQIPSNVNINAFLLLLPHGQHASQYESEVQWLESTFGKEALDYLMIIVTHESKETGAIATLEDISSFDAEKFHICTKHLRDEAEILSLLEKIDVMVSKNDPQDYCRPQRDTRRGQETEQHVENKTGMKLQSKVGDGIDKAAGASGSGINLECQSTKTDNQTEDKRTKAATKHQHEKEIDELMRRLQLQNRYDNKLTSNKFHQIGLALKDDQDIQERDLFSVYLRKLLMLDYRARYVQAKQEQTDEKHSEQDNEETDEETDDCDFFFREKVDGTAESLQSNIHPLDVQMAVFHCSDSFLKLKMVTKLSQCQYALPLLVPDPFTEDIECPLWTFRQIKKTWKKTETKDNSKVVTMKSMPICKAETPMVFCFRLGSLSVSKSQLINTVINDRHSTFFHRNCPGSTKTRLLFDGVAEIAWYYPAGKPSDTFTDCVAFCNLHGDGLTYEKQLNILMDKSSVNVVFVPTLTKNRVISDLLKSPIPLIVLIEDIADGGEKMKKNKYKIGLKDRSQSDVSVDLKNIISKTLSGIESFFHLELNATSMATKDTTIRVDENETCCREGFSAAVEVMKTFDKTEVSRIKKQFLPCQGELWYNWGKINKELYSLKGDRLENERSQKHSELQKLREEQCKASCSGLIKSFIKYLSSSVPTEREYFLQWTQILMDVHATDYLSSVLHSYDQKWTEVLELKKKTDKSTELKSKQGDLAELSKNLQSATCGLEHIFREMGQIYEAHKFLKKTPKEDQTDWSKYPELAAKLMISGYPMELMDGDAGHVPLIWISSLIDQVIHELGDKKVFVLSVLGIQSSGKSTMLNAMFGLQFAVSAGRCTRGAFMQLVKLSEDIREDFEWDYILVVDTEGLRALELDGNSTIHHDNELATFVVGVGNMTLVNIFGENPSEMQDVLQIVVQAFMRMKKVKLSPSCVFVHQNVTDIGAAEKNMDGKRKLQDKLDQMVELAAKEEVCNAESFNDVIDFDVQKDVKYFAQLWEGSPPMAPPNPGYSESVQDLRSYILSKAAKSPGVTLSEFKSKVHDLWNALLNENFVFSFRNTLEIAVYRKLEVQYGNWTWCLRQEMLRIEEHLYTKIENGTFDQVSRRYLDGEIGKKYNEIRKDFLKYFESDKQKEMLIQWQGRFELKIKEFCDELVKGLQRKLSDVVEQKKAGKRLDEKKSKFEDKLLQKSKELAHKLKSKAKDEAELKKQFNHVWEGWVTELTHGTKPIENIVIDEEVDKVLNQLGIESGLIHDSKTSKTYKGLSMLGDFSPYVGQRHQKKKNGKRDQIEKDKNESSVLSGIDFFVETGKKWWTQITGHLPQKEQNLIRAHINTVEKEALQLMKSKPLAKRGWNSSYLHEVASYVITRVADFESNFKYSLKKSFTVDLILYVFDKASEWISQSHAQYIKSNDANTYLESKKSEYYNVFRSFCRGNSSAVVLAEVISEKLKASMTEAVCNRTAIDIADNMRSNDPAFNETRVNLEKHVLTSLAEKEDFDSYITYIHSPNTYIETFIKEKVNEYILSEENIFLVKKNVDVIEKVVTQALYVATTKVQEGGIDIWLHEFHSLLKEKLTIVPFSSKNFSDVNKFDFLKDAIEKDLVPIINDLKQLPLTKLKEFRMQPDQMLIDQLCNCCWETCPFCAAVCTYTVKDHSPDKHCVPFHRPAGIKGWHTKDTVELDIHFCTTSVASDGCFIPEFNSDQIIPYKQYQDAGGKYAEWSITPTGSKLVYWKWFTCKFQKELEGHHDKLKFEGRGEIPSEWKKFTKVEAIESLKEM